MKSFMGEKVRLDFYSTLFNKIFTFILLLAQGILISRWLGPEGKGLQAKLGASTQVATTFLEIGLSSALVYFVSSKKWKTNQATALVIIYTALCSISIGLVYLLSHQTSFFDMLYPTQNKLPFFLFYFSGATILEILRFQLVSLLSAHTLFRQINFTESVFGTLRTLTLFIMISIFPEIDALNGAIAYLKFDLTLSLFVMLTYIGFYFKYIHIRPSFNFEKSFIWVDLKNFAGLNYLSNLVNFLLVRIDYWYVEHFLGLKKLGIYSIAVSLSTGLTFAPLAMSAVLLPHLAKLDSGAQQKDLFSSYSRFSNSFLFMLSLLLTGLAPWVIPLLFGESFSESVIPFQVMIWGYWLASFKYLLGTYFKATNKLRVRLLSDTVGLITCAGLNFWLTPRFGLTGTAFSFLVAQLVSVGCFWATQPEEFPLPKELFLVRRSDISYFIKFDFFKKTKP